MNTMLDQELATDHQASLNAGLREYDNQWVKDNQMANDLQHQFMAENQAREENKAYWVANAFQDAQALNLLLDRPNTTVEDCRSVLCKAIISLSKVRSLAMGDDR